MKIIKKAVKKGKMNAAGCGAEKVNSSHCPSKKSNQLKIGINSLFLILDVNILKKISCKALDKHIYLLYNLKC